MLMSTSLILTEIHNTGYTYRSLFINRFHEQYIIEQVHSIMRGLVQSLFKLNGIQMALNRAQHFIEHIDSIKEAVVLNKYNIFIPGII